MLFKYFLDTNIKKIKKWVHFPCRSRWRHWKRTRTPRKYNLKQTVGPSSQTADPLLSRKYSFSLCLHQFSISSWNCRFHLLCSFLENNIPVENYIHNDNIHRLSLVDSDQKLFFETVDKRMGEKNYITVCHWDRSHPRNSVEVESRLFCKALPADIREKEVWGH